MCDDTMLEADSWTHLTPLASNDVLEGKKPHRLLWETMRNGVTSTFINHCPKEGNVPG